LTSEEQEKHDDDNHHTNDLVEALVMRPKGMKTSSFVICRNYVRAWVYLCRAHYIDSAGTDEDELISTGGQFVAYVPSMAPHLLHYVLHAWPRQSPAMATVAIRAIARILMTAPPLSLSSLSSKDVIKVMARLAQCIESPQLSVAKEALAFASCPFVMSHFVSRVPGIYTILSTGFHVAATTHWHEGIRSIAAASFDAILDFAP
jgi:hypothetical protein